MKYPYKYTLIISRLSIVNGFDILNFRILKPEFVAQGQRQYVYVNFRTERRLASPLGWPIQLEEGPLLFVSSLSYWGEVLSELWIKSLPLYSPWIHSVAKEMAQA